MISFYVFHNGNVLSMFRGLAQGDDLKLVHHLETTRQFDSEAHMLRTLFCWFNHSSGQTMEGYKDRSLTTGDVITVVRDHEDKTSYAYAVSGWLKLPEYVGISGPYGYYRRPQGQGGIDSHGGLKHSTRQRSDHTH